MILKARVKIIGGNLALVETELGQKCVVPLSTVCELADRFNLELEGFNCSNAKKKK